MVNHVYPLNDLKEHDTENVGSCACNPKVEIVEGGMIVIHNSYDRREIIERVNEILDSNKPINQ